MKLINWFKKLILPDHSDIQIKTYWLNKDGQTEVIEVIRKLEYCVDTIPLNSKNIFKNKIPYKQFPSVYSFNELKRFYKQISKEKAEELGFWAD